MAVAGEDRRVVAAEEVACHVPDRIQAGDGKPSLSSTCMSSLMLRPPTMTSSADFRIAA